MPEKEKRRLLRELEKVTSELGSAKNRRDEVVKEAFKAGLPRKEIAEMTGLSMARIYQIARSG